MLGDARILQCESGQEGLHRRKVGGIGRYSSSSNSETNCRVLDREEGHSTFLSFAFRSH